jgi:hypothetical protein
MPLAMAPLTEPEDTSVQMRPAETPAPEAGPAPTNAPEKAAPVARSALSDATAAPAPIATAVPPGTPEIPVAKPAPSGPEAGPVPVALPIPMPRVRKPPLPPEFRGTMDDIRQFLGWGKILFLVGMIVYLVAALMNFVEALGHVLRGDWPGSVVDNIVWAIIDVILVAGAFLCYMLSRQKLMEPFEDNDYAVLHRRLPLAIIAGVVFGVVVGGVLYMLAYVKVDELPSQYKGLPPPPPVQ